jgi:hypothetical protein
MSTQAFRAFCQQYSTHLPFLALGAPLQAWRDKGLIPRTDDSGNGVFWILVQPYRDKAFYGFVIDYEGGCYRHIRWYKFGNAFFGFLDANHGSRFRRDATMGSSYGASSAGRPELTVSRSFSGAVRGLHQV